MNLREAIKAIYAGKKVALPEWSGYWFLGEDGGIKCYTKDDKIVDTPWFSRYAERDDWEEVEGKHTPKVKKAPIQMSAISVTQHDVNENMKDVTVRTLNDFGKPATYVTVRMKNGYTLRDSTTCVDPANYNEEVGKKICLEHIEDKVWKLLGYEMQYVGSAKNKELAITRNMMISPDYKVRFKAEYIQLLNRFQGLKRMLESWDNGTLNFKPTCPREMYNEQVEGMEKYLKVLVRRADLEDVDISVGECQ